MIQKISLAIIAIILFYPFTVDSAFYGSTIVPGSQSNEGLFLETDTLLGFSGWPDNDDGFIPDEAFIKANELYIGGSYEEAIIVYEQIINSGYQSPVLYYNLGNAYYRSNIIPSAILNYERAALLSPGDEDISFNLELARLHVRDRIEQLPDFFLNRWWNNLRDMTSAARWAYISLFTFITALFLLSAFLVSSSIIIKKTFFWLAVIIFFGSILSFSLGLDQKNYIRNHSTAIVFSPVVSVKSSPDVNSTVLFVIHEGTKVWVRESIGEWRAVRISDGNKGWLHKNAIRMI